MHHLRLLIIALAAIFVLALAALALVNRPVPQTPVDDDIVIKGGSLEIRCGKSHKTDNAGCLGLDDGALGVFKHKQNTKHITRIVVRTGANRTLFDSASANVNLGASPEVVITYKN